MSYYNLYSRVRISTRDGNTLQLGSYPDEEGLVESIIITESVKEMGDNCKVVIPRNIRYLKGKRITDLIKEGDRVTVAFGYNGLNEEFAGYIKEISGTSPITLDLDDEFYPLRKNSNTKSYPDVTLEKLLTDIAPGYKIDCPKVSMGKYLIDRATSYQVLKDINQRYGFYSFIRNGTLHCRWAYDVRGFGQQHEYRLCDTFDQIGRRLYVGNVRPGGNNLKYVHASSTDIAVEVCVNRRNGKKYKIRVGSKAKEASVRKLTFGTGVTDAQAKEIAEKTFEGLNFDGYRGTITGYGLPRTNAGDSLKITDYEYPERDGIYLIEKVIKRYDKGGIARENTLSYKI